MFMACGVFHPTLVVMKPKYMYVCIRVCIWQHRSITAEKRVSDARTEFFCSGFVRFFAEIVIGF